MSSLCHHCLQITEPRTPSSSGTALGQTSGCLETSGRLQGLARGPSAEGERSRQPESSASPRTVRLFPDTRQHHLCPLPPGSTSVVSQQLEKRLWSRQHCTEGYLVICNGFSIPVIVSSPELRERERRFAGRWAGSKGFGEAWGFAIQLGRGLRTRSVSLIILAG